MEKVFGANEALTSFVWKFGLTREKGKSWMCTRGIEALAGIRDGR